MLFFRSCSVPPQALYCSISLLTSEILSKLLKQILRKKTENAGNTQEIRLHPQTKNSFRLIIFHHDLEQISDFQYPLQIAFKQILGLNCYSSSVNCSRIFSCINSWNALGVAQFSSHSLPRRWHVCAPLHNAKPRLTIQCSHQGSLQFWSCYNINDKVSFFLLNSLKRSLKAKECYLVNTFLSLNSTYVGLFSPLLHAACKLATMFAASQVTAP